MLVYPHMSSMGEPLILMACSGQLRLVTRC